MDFVWIIFLSKNEPFISAYTQICIIKNKNKIKDDSKLPNNTITFFKSHFLANFQTKTMSQNNSKFCC